MTDTFNAETLLAEDAALKTKLTGLTVPAERSAGALQTVEVWYRWPQREYEHVDWPFITIDLTDVAFDATRAHSYNWDYQDYVPDTIPFDPLNPDEPPRFYAPYPVPFELTYVVASHCRNAQHDRELFRQLLQPWNLPYRFGFFTIGINAEMLPEEALAVRTKIQKVIFNVRSAGSGLLLDQPNYTIT